MKKLPLIAICGLTLLTGAYFLNRNLTKEKTTEPRQIQVSVPTTDESLQSTNSSKYIKVANWNLQIFGDAKASKPELMNTYANTLTNFDIAFVQEIRDSDSSSFDALCSMLTNYNSRISSRAGRSSSKEQYGVLYKKGIKLEEMKDYNPDAQNRWERPPIEVSFNIEGYKLRAYNIHTKPAAVKSELASLEEIVSTNGNSVILGDLNASGSYYNPTVNTELDSWKWVIKDSEDTTVSKTDCAYDRIIMNNDAYQEYSTSGVSRAGIIKEVSDHFPVWVELKVK
ncbi:MAG: endonuclease/exonuclease/phosphatase family protein [archaeon]